MLIFLLKFEKKKLIIYIGKFVVLLKYRFFVKNYWVIIIIIRCRYVWLDLV